MKAGEGYEEDPSTMRQDPRVHLTIVSPGGEQIALLARCSSAQQGEERPRQRQEPLPPDDAPATRALTRSFAAGLPERAPAVPAPSVVTRALWRLTLASEASHICSDTTWRRAHVF